MLLLTRPAEESNNNNALYDDSNAPMFPSQGGDEMCVSEREELEGRAWDFRCSMITARG